MASNRQDLSLLERLRLDDALFKSASPKEYEALLIRNADPNAGDETSHRPLHLVTVEGSTPKIISLLKYNADPSIRSGISNLLPEDLSPTLECRKLLVEARKAQEEKRQLSPSPFSSSATSSASSSPMLLTRKLDSASASSSSASSANNTPVQMTRKLTSQ